MKKILYITHVSWSWIKQRPQFLAEKLTNGYKVDYYYGRSVFNNKATNTQNSEVSGLTLRTFKIFPFVRIPFIGKSAFFVKLNWRVAIRQIPNVTDYDVIWFTTPEIFPALKNRITSAQKVVYDCMDDMIEFPETKNNLSRKRYVLQSEEKIMNSNAMVFCSSESLKNAIVQRTNTMKDIHVINNAIELPHHDYFSLEEMPEDVREKYKRLSCLNNVFMYVGTVSEWFDFEKMDKLTKDFPTINIVLLGPSYSTNIPSSPQIHYLGTIERKYIFTFMNKASALIMPFMLNNLIESVNPVKLYEYIYAKKPSIAPLYKESEKFSEFVYLYDDYLHLKVYVKEVLDGTISLPLDSVINDFVIRNTWEDRVQCIRKYLD